MSAVVFAAASRVLIASQNTPSESMATRAMSLPYQLARRAIMAALSTISGKRPPGSSANIVSRTAAT
jgi:hypothetical protein